jgi:hypothetical protein
MSLLDRLKKLPADRLAAERARLIYLALAELSRRYSGDVPEPAAAAGRLTPYEHRVFSQNGEDGVIAELVRRVGAPGRWFVEFGGGLGVDGNCLFLADVLGWDGLFIEPAAEWHAKLAAKYEPNPRVRVLPDPVTPANVEALFERGGVPEEPDVLSIDVDGNDYWIWEAIESYRPRIVVIEYNPALDPGRRLVQRLDPSPGAYDGSDDFGASLGALRALGEGKGYRFVHTDLTGTNAFFVRADLPADPALPDDPPVFAANIWLAGREHARSDRASIIDLDAAQS